jgi:hypothetical protein
MAEIVPPIDHPETARQGLIPLDLSALFWPYTPRRVQLQLNPRLAHLEHETETVRVRHVLRGFVLGNLILEAHGLTPASFAIIGPGSGAEAIGAAHIFPAVCRLVLRDRDALILAGAAVNVRRHVRESINVISQAGNIYAPLALAERPVDLLFANFSDIPFTDAPEAVADRGAYWPPVTRTDHDSALNLWRLAFAYGFLRSAPATLTPQGSALILLGGRFPYGVFDRLAEAAGLHFQELRSWLQPQADPGNVLAGFAAAETAGAPDFDFYDVGQAEPVIAGRILHGEELKAALAPYRLSASAALKAFRGGRMIGYTAHLMLATPFRSEVTIWPEE